MNKLISLVLAIMVGVLGWMLYQTQMQLDVSRNQVQLLQQSLEVTQAEVADLKDQVAELDRTSIQGLVRDANDAILDGWEAMVKTVEEEVKRARKTMEQSLPQDNTAQPPKNQPPKEEAPQLESPDGTDRT
jgi:cell division protein FtsL